MKLYNLDQWDGYVAARNRILGFLSDIHSSWVHDLKADFADPASRTVGTEFVGTSISSVHRAGNAALPDNPHTKFFNGALRGYVRCDVTPQRWTSTFRVVDNALVPGARPGRSPPSPSRTVARERSGSSCNQPVDW